MKILLLNLCFLFLGQFVSMPSYCLNDSDYYSDSEFFSELSDIKEDDEEEDELCTLEILVLENDAFVSRFLNWMCTNNLGIDHLTKELIRLKGESKANVFLEKHKAKINLIAKTFDNLKEHLENNTKDKLYEKPKIKMKINNDFYGNHLEAINADGDLIYYYNNLIVLIEMAIEKQRKKHDNSAESLSTYINCFHLIEDLFHFHLNLHQIAYEFYLSKKSHTYDNLTTRNRAIVRWSHTENKILFEDQANLLLLALMSAVDFAQDNRLMDELLVFLGQTQGSLDQRIMALWDWLEFNRAKPHQNSL